MASPKRLYLESLRVGDELPTLVKPAIDRVQIARFCGAAGDFSPMHLDEPLAKAEGMRSVTAHTLLPMSFMSQFLTDWLKGGRLTRLAVRFVKLVWPGDVLSCKGRVLSRRRDEQGRYFVDIDLWAENQKGEMVLKGHSTGQLFFSAEDENQQKRGEGPLIVDVSEQSELPRNSKGKLVRSRPALVEDEDDDDDEDDELDESEEPEEAPEEAPVKKPAKKVVAKAAGKK